MSPNERKKRRDAIKRNDKQDMVCCTRVLAKRYLSDFSDDAWIWCVYGISLGQIARYPEALAALRKAARLCPPNKLHFVQSHFGHLYKRKGNFRRAEAWFRRAIVSSPSDASAYIYLGALFAVEGRLREAEAMHRKATRCKDGCIDEAFLNLGLVLRAQEKYAKAKRCFQRALQIDPKYRAAKKELADVKRVIELNREA